jgi:hypothetical protein
MRMAGVWLLPVMVVLAGGLLAAACGRPDPMAGGAAPDTSRDAHGPFADDLAFLRGHTELVLLEDAATGAQVAVAPAYQGRVMTSTVGGPGAPSFGWIGRTAVASGERQPHMNVFGGEDRFWLGPEGGQYALYFAAGDPFDVEHWQVPAAFDWDRWDVAEQSASEVRFRKRMSLENYARTRFDLEVDRQVRLLSADAAARALDLDLPSTLRMVAFESSNTVTNRGTAAWTADSGLVSIWILGQFTPSPDTTIVIPYRAAPGGGPVVHDAYFGKVPGDRLQVAPSAIFFRGDGHYRSKIGVPPERARGLAGSYDAAAHVLTLVSYSQPEGVDRYVNSAWELQREPYKGDAINSYNDGPLAPGSPGLGPFYELETSSPALALSPGDAFTHVHRTMHLTGPEADLDRIARAALSVGLADIAGALPH